MQFLAVIAVVGLIVWQFRKHSPNREKEPDDWLDFQAAEAHINRLNELRHQIQAIEELLTDIQLHEAGKSDAPITLSWATVSGMKQEAVIYINASPEVNTKLTELAQSERQRLRFSLQSELQNTPIRHNANDYANDTAITTSNDRRGVHE